MIQLSLRLRMAAPSSATLLLELMESEALFGIISWQQQPSPPWAVSGEP